MKTPVNKAKQKSDSQSVKWGPLQGGCGVSAWCASLQPGVVRRASVPLPCLHQWQPKRDMAWPSPISVATAGRQLLAGAASAACGCPLGTMGCNWRRLVRETSFPCCLSTHSRAGVHQPKTLPDFTRRLLVPKKPSTEVVIWLAVRVSKMLVNLRMFFLSKFLLMFWSGSINLLPDLQFSAGGGACCFPEK